jgi:hypothetical protein
MYLNCFLRFLAAEVEPGAVPEADTVADEAADAPWWDDEEEEEMAAREELGAAPFCESRGVRASREAVSERRRAYW